MRTEKELISIALFRYVTNIQPIAIRRLGVYGECSSTFPDREFQSLHDTGNFFVKEVHNYRID